MEMEVKKSRAAAAAVLCCMLFLLMLSGQQQRVAASIKSEFCACYKECYHGCRNDHVPRLVCIPYCANKCCPQPTAGGDSCRIGCAGIKICGLSDPRATEAAADAEACVQNCNEKWSHEPTK